MYLYDTVQDTVQLYLVILDSLTWLKPILDTPRVLFQSVGRSDTFSPTWWCLHWCTVPASFICTSSVLEQRGRPLLLRERRSLDYRYPSHQYLLPKEDAHFEHSTSFWCCARRTTDRYCTSSSPRLIVNHGIATPKTCSTPARFAGSSFFILTGEGPRTSAASWPVGDD